MMDRIDLIGWLQRARPETPILNNWDLIKFLLPRISPIPTEGEGGKQNQCCRILDCAFREKLVFNDPIFQYICISQTNCNGSRSFSLQHLRNTKTTFMKYQNKTESHNSVNRMYRNGTGETESLILSPPQSMWLLIVLAFLNLKQLNFRVESILKR